MQEKHTQTWNGSGEEFDTIPFQGVITSQTQVLKYTGDQRLIATTGQTMWSEGCNSLKPLNIIYKPHIGVEVDDIRFNVFPSYFSYLNPLNLIGSTLSWGVNKYYGVHFTKPIPENESVAYHVPIISKTNVGQLHDMQSHRQKYETWVSKKERSKSASLLGISRGTAATFCAYAKEKYPEVKLVILEGAIDSTQNILAHYLSYVCPNRLASSLKAGINAGLSFFHKRGYISYDPNGPSPLSYVEEFPENTPVVFITSKIDRVVPCKNTERIARALADRGKNPVYLLKLEQSSHPNYMFDNAKDRNNYEAFIHAIYKEYNLKHNIELARQGAELLAACRLYPADIQSKEDSKSSLAYGM